ncbi:hypothetical protein BH11VER1_BH11VER1_25610 [soil metagenome]
MRTAHPSFAIRPRPKTGGYILLEVIIALTIFSVAVLGLANALKSGIETASIINRENAVRIGLRSFLEEIRRKPIAEMAASTFDARLQTTFSSTVEEISLKDRNGSILKDLYVLQATASFGEGAEALTETVDMYVYKPETQNK